MDVLATATLYLNEFKDMFSKPQFENFTAYETGLWTLEARKNVKHISSLNSYDKNQSSLNRFITHAKWSPPRLRAHIRQLALDKFDPGKMVYAIIDDSITQKTGEHMDGAGWFTSESKGGSVYGHNLVTLLASQGNVSLPVDLRLYEKEEDTKKSKLPFKTKIELAQTMVSCYPFKAGKTTALFDSWYAGEPMFTFCKERGFLFISRLKSNRVVFVGKRKWSVEELCENIAQTEGKTITIGEAKYCVYPAFNATLSDGMAVRLGVSKRLSDGALTVFVSNDFKACTSSLVKRYAIRWKTEELYRDAKQNLGLEDYMLRTRSGVLIHGLLTMAAYAILALVRVSSRLSIFFRGKLNTIGDVIRAFRVGLEERVVQSVFDLTKKGMGLKEIYQKIGLKNAKV